MISAVAGSERPFDETLLMHHDDVFIPVNDKEGIADCLDILMQHSGASLLLSRPGSGPLPVIVMAEAPGMPLMLDISAIREVTTDLKHGMAFRLLGQLGTTFVRSAPLQVRSCEERDGCMQCECEYPDVFEVAQRGGTDCVELQSGRCSVRVSGNGGLSSGEGELTSLSLEACRVLLPLTAAARLAAEIGNLQLELTFSDGARFIVMGSLCRQQLLLEQRVLLVGFQFVELSAEQNRSLWFHIHELERELAGKGRLGSEVSASRSLSMEPVHVPQKAPMLPTPMARGLATIAEILDTQIIALRIGEDIDSALLSRSSESLLNLLDQGRESLLFALHCLIDEPEVVRHCLAVAVRMADITSPLLPRDMCKAVIASAMVHDLGRVLLVPDGLQAPTELLLTRLNECRWLAPEIVRQVVAQANERLDGSGYPHGLRHPELRELARLMAVVKTVDAMGHADANGTPHAVGTTYRHLLRHPEHFDQNWVKRYIHHFGLLPVGTLVRYECGVMAWIRSLDARMQPTQVQLTRHVGPPRVATLGELLQGGALAALGKVVEILTP